jgi:hypothetical protein
VNQSAFFQDRRSPIGRFPTAFEISIRLWCDRGYAGEGDKEDGGGECQGGKTSRCGIITCEKQVSLRFRWKRGHGLSWGPPGFVLDLSSVDGDVRSGLERQRMKER